jgi:phytol kinase
VLGYNDALGTLITYLYILLLFLFVGKLWKGDRSLGRKLLHIGIGNIVFVLWMFDRWYAAVSIAIVFLIFCLLLTKTVQDCVAAFCARESSGPVMKLVKDFISRLPLESLSDAGHEFGLVYYCIAFTILAYVFFKTPVVIAVGILPLAYGDGLGAIIGTKYGRHGYRLIDRKSIEGSLAVFAGTAIAVFAGMVFYGMPAGNVIMEAAVIGAVVAIVEGIFPNGLDNLAIPLSAVLVFLLW